MNFILRLLAYVDQQWFQMYYYCVTSLPGALESTQPSNEDMQQVMRGRENDSNGIHHHDFASKGTLLV